MQRRDSKYTEQRKVNMEPVRQKEKTTEKMDAVKEDM